MTSQSEIGARAGPHTLEDLQNGPGHWYIPLDAPHSSSTSHTPDGSAQHLLPDGSSQHLLSLESGFHLHCPTTFIGTSSATTFLPVNGKFWPF